MAELAAVLPLGNRIPLCGTLLPRDWKWITEV